MPAVMANPAFAKNPFATIRLHTQVRQKSTICTTARSRLTSSRPVCAEHDGEGQGGAQARPGREEAQVSERARGVQTELEPNSVVLS